jgi:hypothetical protein
MHKSYTPRKFPYWKIQYYIDRNMSWFDVQKAYADKDEAKADARKLNKKRVRLMQIDGPSQRTPLPELE